MKNLKGKHSVPPQKTTRLPAALREQIDKESGGSTLSKRKLKQKSRKTTRKQERQEKKQRKAGFFSRPKPSGTYTGLKRRADDNLEPEAERPVKRLRTSVPSADLPPAISTTNNSLTFKNTQGSIAVPKPSSDQGAIDISEVSYGKRSKNPSKRRIREADPEDSRIAWLESKLGITHSKSGPKKLGDGLDDLMDNLDRIVPINEEVSEPESDETGVSESEESFEGFSTAEDGIDCDTEELQQNDGEVVEATASDHTRESAEDRTLDTSVTEPQAKIQYIPPHLRPAQAEELETLSKLSRQIKGLLNRLSEHNIASILSSIEQLYRTYRRNDVTSTLTDLIIDSIRSHSLLLDSFVVLHATLLASLHKIIGVELAAHFVQSLVKSYEKCYGALKTSEAADDEVTGKECLNLVVLLSELYNFRVVSCVLIYDIVRSLLNRLDEFDVELLLKIARTSGQQLRQDDPTALREIVDTVQTGMGAKDESTISSRTRFMIETLANLKTGKTKRATKKDNSSDSVDRMKNFLSSLSNKHHILAHEPLRVTLDDLHSSEKKGKWWLVGSAWSGNPLLDHAQAVNQHTKKDDSAKNGAHKLLKLAQKQGMNTDVRRNIFVVLISSNDYVDACERLSQLNLTEVQQREAIRVVLHCLGNEKSYNPYYTLVVQQLCKKSHSHRVTVQYGLWDFLRTLGEHNVGGAEVIKDIKEEKSHAKVSPTKLLNVARAYAWWLAKDCSSITILKPVDFTVLQPQTVEFFRALFLQLFISTQVSSPMIFPNDEAVQQLAGLRNREALEEVFGKTIRIPALTRGLLYFFTKSLWGDDVTGNIVVVETLKWACGVAKEILRTGLDPGES